MPNPDGICEELFVSGTEVWFRNWSVTADLGLRASGILQEDPESVRWGQTKDRFVVRTGINHSDFKYYIFRIPRFLTIFGEGVIPSVTREHTISPSTSTLGLVTVAGTITETRHNGQGTNAIFATAVSIANTAGCVASLTSFTLLVSPFNMREVDTGNGTNTFQLNSSALSVTSYGLDDDGALILFLTANLPSFTFSGTKSVFGQTGSCATLAQTQTDSAKTLTANPRSSETHLFVVRLVSSGDPGTVLFRTTASSPTVVTNNSTKATPFIHGLSEQRTLTGGPGGVGQCAPGVTCSGGGSGGPGGTALNVDLGSQNDSGFITRQDSLWDTSIPFLSDNEYGSPTTTVATFSLSISGGLYNDNGNNVQWETFAQRTEDTRTIAGTPWTYAVQRAYPTRLRERFLVVVRRSRSGSTAQVGLFYRTNLGWTTIQTFMDEPAGFIELRVMTANEDHTIWYVEADTSRVYLTALRANRTKEITGTTLAILRADRLRLLQGDLANPMDVLWKGEERAGQFVEAWETDGTPNLQFTSVGAGYPLSPLDPYARLVSLPPNLAPGPVIPVG